MRKILFILAMGMIVGCQAPIGPTKGEISESIENSISYLKDRHGICYATIRSWTYTGHYVTALATVPCEKVGL